jgi:hypothetical protein
VIAPRFLTQEREIGMFNELVQQIEAQGYWYSASGSDSSLTLNVQDPSEAPTKRDLKYGRGVIMTVQVSPERLLAGWAEYGAGYDEHWEFSNVSEFMAFLDKFLEEGIDAV